MNINDNSSSHSIFNNNQDENTNTSPGTLVYKEDHSLCHCDNKNNQDEDISPGRLVYKNGHSSFHCNYKNNQDEDSLSISMNNIGSYTLYCLAVCRGKTKTNPTSSQLLIKSQIRGLIEQKENLDVILATIISMESWQVFPLLEKSNRDILQPEFTTSSGFALCVWIIIKKKKKNGWIKSLCELRKLLFKQTEIV